MGQKYILELHEKINILSEFWGEENRQKQEKKSDPFHHIKVMLMLTFIYWALSECMITASSYYTPDIVPCAFVLYFIQSK